MRRLISLNSGVPAASHHSNMAASVLVSTTPVGALERDEVDFIASSYCPLSAAERKRLKAKQSALAQPVLTQKELF